METIERQKTQTTEAVILAYSLHDYKSELKINDLVMIDDEFYNIVKIDPRYGVKLDEPDNEHKYFVQSKINDNLMNFERKEISKATLGYFHAKPYFENNVKKLICQVPITNPDYKTDINYIKAKFACDWDMGKSEFDHIQTSQLHELTIEGTIKEHKVDIMYHNEQPNFKSFKVNIK